MSSAVQCSRRITLIYKQTESDCQIDKLLYNRMQIHKIKEYIVIQLILIFQFVSFIFHSYLQVTYSLYIDPVIPKVVENV